MQNDNEKYKKQKNDGTVLFRNGRCYQTLNFDRRIYPQFFKIVERVSDPTDHNLKSIKINRQIRSWSNAIPNFQELSRQHHKTLLLNYFNRKFLIPN